MKRMTNKDEEEIDDALLKSKVYKKYFERISNIFDIDEFDNFINDLIRFIWTQKSKIKN